MSDNENIIDVINSKYGNQSNCAKELGWSRQTLNKIVRRKREARVSEINELANVLQLPVSKIIYFLTC